MRGAIENDGVQLVYDHETGTATPVVLLHGGGQNRHSWGKLAETLRLRGHEVISLDQRGHGDSAWAERYRLVDYAGDVTALLSTIGRPSIIVGASLGGLAGLLAATADAATVAALILVDITTRPKVEGTDKILGFMRAHIDGFQSLDDAATAVNTYLGHRPRPSQPDDLRRNLRLDENGRWRWRWDPTILDDSIFDDEMHRSLDDAARSLTVPVLLVRGEHSDVVRDDDIAHFQTLAPHAQSAVVPGARHMVAGDRNDAFAQVIAGYLAKISKHQLAAATDEREDRRGVSGS